MHAYRTHTCAQLRAGDVGEAVRLSGWVHRVRDHGGILFIDLRDHYGITQVLADPDSPAFAEVEKVRSEWVIRIDGEVKAREPELVNPKLPTGEVEVFIREIEVLGAAEELPLPVFGDVEYPEETRLTYRFLDLRREKLHRNILLRSAVTASIRRGMEAQGFVDFQTPILTASSPEGARDFLVPSRLHPGKVYALPQAPQQFKQLIMVAGFDRYYQIAPCFRDEDPRADRSPGEFYQLDVEMSFVTQDDVFAAMEPVLAEVFWEHGDFETGQKKPITTMGKVIDMEKPAAEREPFARIPYADAMRWYGSDKPDLRNPIRMEDVSEHFRGGGFGVFAGILAKNDKAEIRAIPAPGGGSRAFCDRMDGWAKKEGGLPGLAYIFWREDGGAGPVAKNLGPERTEALRDQLGLKAGDAVFFCAGEPATFEDAAGKARNIIGEELGLTDKDRFDFAWIVDFPMYEYDDEAKKVDFSHNPFSMPQGGLEALQTQDPLEVKAWQYDVTCNGYEIVSGGIRNHKPEIMFRAFEIAGYGRAEVEARFGGMVNAFRYGAPPHGGCAAGLDRLVMLLAGEQTLREVIMFPKNQRAEDLMMSAPAEPANEQLRELGLRYLPRE